MSIEGHKKKKKLSSFRGTFDGSGHSHGYGDKLILRGLKFNAIHGVNDDEKKFPQPFLLDIDVWIDMRKASRTDDLDHTVSYTTLYK